MTYISESAEQTLKIAGEFSKTLKDGDIVLLKGEMGSGKTLFAKGIINSFFKDAAVTSPTFAYVNEYGNKIYHFDMYRVKSGEHAESLGLIEMLYSGKICIVEWPENIASHLLILYKTVKIEVVNESKRRISI